MVCEGVEDGLTLLQVTGLPVRAALGTSGLAGFPFPYGLQELLVARDNDPPRQDGGPPPGQQAAQTLLHRATAQGIPARVIAPPDGIKDFNDFWNTNATQMQAHLERITHD